MKRVLHPYILFFFSTSSPHIFSVKNAGDVQSFTVKKAFSFLLFFVWATFAIGQLQIASNVLWGVGTSQNGPYSDPVYDVSGCVDEAYIDDQCGTSYASPMLDQHFAGCPSMMPIWAIPPPANCIFPPSINYWFHYNFDLDCISLESAIAKMQGDQNFDLYINGTLVGSSGNGQWQVVYTYDVTGLMANGNNEILIRSSNVSGGSCFNYAFIAFCLDITFNNTPPFTMMPDVAICPNETVQLQASPGAISYNWTPDPTLSATDIANPFATPTTTTTYTVAIVYPCDYVQIDDVTVTVVDGQAVANPFEIIPCDNNGAGIYLNGNGSSTAAGAFYNWTTSNGNIVSGANTLTPLVNMPGLYELTVTMPGPTGNFCVTSAFVEVDEGVPPIAVANTETSIDCNTFSGTVEGLGSTIGPDIFYEWTTLDGFIISGIHELSAEVLSGGTYVLTVTQIGTNCTAEASVLVESDTVPPGFEIAPPGELNCSVTEIALDTINTQAGFAYNWTTTNGNILSGNDTPQPTINLPGIYVLTVTDPSNGCTAIDSVNVTTDTLPPMAEAGTNQQLDCSAATIFLDGTGSSMGGNFSYLWSTANGNIINDDTTLQPEIGASGTYFLTVTNNLNGCTSGDEVIITGNNDVPTAAISANDTLNCLVDTLILDGTSSSSGVGYSFVWSTANGNFVSGENSLLPVIDQSGIYTLTVTDLTSNCTSTATATVESNFLTPIADAGIPDQLTCTNDTLSLNGSNSVFSNNDEIHWTTIDGTFAAGENTLMPTITAPGTYTLVITNPETGCIDSATVEIDENNNPPLADAGMPMELTCISTSLVLDGSASSQNGNFTYQWTTQDGHIVSGDSSLTPIIDAAGTYLLTVVDNDNGCENTSEVAVTLNGDFPNAEAGPTDELNCITTAITLSGAGETGTAITYEWTTVDGEIIADENTLTPVVGAGGTYTLTVTNQDNGCSMTDSVFISENTALPNVDAGSTNELSCTQTQLALMGSGSAMSNDISYLWTTPNGNILSGESAPNPLVNAAGTYWLTILNNENGCADSDSVIITQDDNLPTADAGNPDTLTCDVTTFLLDGSGSSANPNITYLWTTTEGNIVFGETTLSPEINAPGTYLLTVTDTTNNCEAFSSVLITENTAPPAANAGSNGLLTCNVTTLILDGSASANGPDITYLWAYTPPIGGAGGGILSGETTLSPEIDAPGIYELLVTNLATGCTNTATVEVVENTAPPTVLIENPDVLTCAILEITLDASNSSTGNTLSYLWTTTNGNIVSGDDSLAPTIDAAGNYDLLITNTLNGCTANASVSVSENMDAPTAEAGQSVGLDCTTIIATLDGTGSSLGGNFQYLWTTSDGNIVSGETTLSPQVDAAGFYTLTVLDEANGCSSTDQVEVTLGSDAPVVVIAMPDVLTCLQTQIALDASGSSMGSNFQYNWTTSDGNILSGGGTLQPAVDQPGTYTLVITNMDNGCTSFASTTVAEETDLPAVDAGPPFELNCHFTQTNLMGNTDLAAGEFTANWTTANGQILSGNQTLSPLVDAPGLYTLTIRNTATGCTDSAEVTITENLFLGFDFDQQDPTCESPTGWIEFADVQGGTPPFSYSVDDGQTFSDQTIYQNLLPGVYGLIVQDANGCELGGDAFLTTPSEIVVILEAEAVVKLGASYQLHALTNLPADEIASIEWTPAETLSCDDCLNPWAMPLQQTVYQVKVTSVDGCTATATTALFIDKNIAIYAPNAFSPNGDGINDIFHIYASDHVIVKINSFKIFSRWGESVFEGFDFPPNDPQYGWDGRHRGKPMNPAVFVWFAEVELVDGSLKFLEGDVVLVK